MMLAGSLLVSVAVAMPASAASRRTYHFFSKQITSQTFDATGKAITNPNAAPAAGDYFIATDNDYVGNHKKHVKSVYATDHIICTFLTVDTTNFSFTAVSDAQLALPGGMLILDRAAADLQRHDGIRERDDSTAHRHDREPDSAMGAIPTRGLRARPARRHLPSATPDGYGPESGRIQRPGRPVRARRGARSRRDPAARHRVRRLHLRPLRACRRHRRRW